MRRPDPRSYDEYFRAYSMAILGKERENVSYGGKSEYPLVASIPTHLTSALSSYHATICSGKIDPARPGITVDVQAQQSF